MEGASVGLVVVGLGSVGSSLIAGVLAAREHLVHPFGSLVEAGGAGRDSGARSLRDEAPLAELNSLALGAFELHDDDAHRAALRRGQKRARAELGGAARASCFCPLIEALDRSIHSRYCGRRALDPLEPRRGQERSEGAP
ncbi:MAG TPA: inositol-3-phosphate synthase [Myxococcales bacterium]